MPWITITVAKQINNFAEGFVAGAGKEILGEPDMLMATDISAVLRRCKPWFQQFKNE
jgi:hypothetical protein